MILMNQSQEKILSTNLQQAKGFSDRLLGMMGKKDFPESYALWIHKCNSVTTHFMKIEIDVVFVDKNLEVKKVIWNMKKWKMSPFVWAAESVFEFPTGNISKDSICVGDKLHVEP